MTQQPCDREAMMALANALGGSPWTATAVHLLRRNMATAYVTGHPSSPEAPVVFWSSPLSTAPRRANAYGTDVGSIWRLLQRIGDWNAVGIRAEQADGLRALMLRDLSMSPHMESHLYHVLQAPVHPFTHPLVRRLTESDIDLVRNAPPFLQQGRLFGGALELLRSGVFFGAVDLGQLVATAHTATLTPEYAEIGVATLSRYRRQSIAAAAASQVCQCVQAMGRVPVWDCAEENEPSRRLAHRLGFVQIGGRVDLIPDSGAHGTASGTGPSTNR